MNDDKVIKFPNNKDTVLKKEQDDLKPMFLGAFTFTCSCSTVATIKPQNMIFKTMEFYCKDCGTAHRVTNPAFGLMRPEKSR